MTTATDQPTKNLRKSLFDRYDPFTQEVPEFTNPRARWAIDYVLITTRKDLEGRGKEELIDTYWFLQKLMREAEHQTLTAAIRRADQPKGPKSEYMTEQKAILELFSNYNIENNGPLINGTPEEYFSVLALMSAYEAIHSFYEAERLSVKQDRDFLENGLLDQSESVITDSANRARELISFIDGMIFRKQEQGKTNRKAASHRHQSTNQIKANYVAWYKENHLTTKSKNQAAIQFHSMLCTEDQRKIQPEALIKHLRTESKRNPNILL